MCASKLKNQRTLAELESEESIERFTDARALSSSRATARAITYRMRRSKMQFNIPDMWIGIGIGAVAMFVCIVVIGLLLVR